jgi:hypothetical protein
MTRTSTYYRAWLGSLLDAYVYFQIRPDIKELQPHRTIFIFIEEDEEMLLIDALQRMYCATPVSVGLVGHVLSETFRRDSLFDGFNVDGIAGFGSSLP